MMKVVRNTVCRNDVATQAANLPQRVPCRQLSSVIRLIRFMACGLVFVVEGEALQACVAHDRPWHFPFYAIRIGETWFLKIVKFLTY